MMKEAWFSDGLGQNGCQFGDDDCYEACPCDDCSTTGAYTEDGE